MEMNMNGHIDAARNKHSWNFIHMVKIKWRKNDDNR
jgi:hypothetical protein